MPELHIPVETETLANGLRVVVSPNYSAPIATIGVYYQIGFRLEPRGRSGFAHLFEHMMFQGSEHAAKMEHIRLINSSGGVANGSTRYDFTNYYEVVPSNALDRVLWLEADRMRALKVNEENLHNQRDVVKEEVRVNVLNRPYGGFPWLDLPPVAFRKWPNAHNFYGDFADLDAASLDDVRAFFYTYYAPNNAVLLMVGDVDPKKAFRLARRYFDDIPRQPLPAVADVAEPPQPEERRGRVEETFAKIPALALGYHAPERRGPGWHVASILDRFLHGGRAGRIYRHLVLEKQIALDASGGFNGSSGSIIDYNGPTLLVTTIFHKPEYSAEATIAAFDDVIRDVCEHRVSEDELQQVKVKLRADFYSMLESAHGGLPRVGLMHTLACFTLFDDGPHHINTAVDSLCAVTPAEVQSVAQQMLMRENRAILIRQPAPVQQNQDHCLREVVQ
ncbi:MAG TPA: pitrilysin family protein [Terriglobia bacterium]|nr:pitrilysin family protein [Terriglobia bacterium]